MNARLLIVTLVAFGASLGAGKLLFSNTAAPIAQPAERRASEVVAAKLVSSPPAALDAAAAPKSMPLKHSTIDRQFKAVENGVLNENARMSTQLSTLYAEGVVHKVPAQFDAMISWRPATQEHRRDNEIVSINRLEGSSRARVDSHGGLQRVAYPSTYAETDEYFYVRPEGGVEHDIVLNSAPVTLDPANGLAYTGFLKLSKGLTMWDDKTQITGNYATRNGIFFKNAFGNSVFYLRAPVAYDADVTLQGGGMDIDKQALPENQKHAIACEYQVSFEDGGIKLAVVTPGNWLLSNERAYPVTIDPNFGPFGLADGDPPIYVGSAGTDTLVPAFNAGTKLAIEDYCKVPRSGPTDDGYGHVAMPFPFVFYGVNHPINSFLFVHIDGFASWVPPFPLYDPFTPPHGPCFDNGNPAFSGNTAIPSATYPTDAFFAYWDDLRFSADPKSGIYYFVDGVAPSRRLIFEWHAMTYFQPGTASDVISFNMILYECANQIQYTYKNLGDKDRGSASIGIENSTGTIGVQYCFNSLAVGLPEIAQGTSVTFSVSPLSNIKVTSSNTQGCAPLTACFGAKVTLVVPPCQQLTGGLPVPPSFAFHWTFQDGAEAFTPNVCHTYIKPGNYGVQLIITDEFGNKATIANNLAVSVCDTPPVIMTVDPQGGTAPLVANISMKSISPVILIGNTPTDTIVFNNAQTHIQIDRVGDQNEPGVIAPFMDIPGTSATVRFDTPGNYRVLGIFGGTSFGLGTTGYNTAYVTVQDPNGVVANSLLITDSIVAIDWAGKLPNAAGVLKNPNNDTIAMNGYLNLSGLNLSALAGQEIFIAMNAYNPIFHGFLDGAGNAVMADLISGTTGTFKLSANGAFSCSVKGDFAASMSLNSVTEHRLLATNYRIQIGDIFNTPGTTVSYNYSSNLGHAAKGLYKFGVITKAAPIQGAPPGFNSPSTQQFQVSGAFMILKADFMLQGDVVNATLSGVLARAGGDTLRPAATSDVVVKINNFSETLNFSTTPTFKVTGKSPQQKFSFKSSGNTHIQKLGWTNMGGVFYISAINMPNAQVGIVPGAPTQQMKLTFTVTPDSAQQFIGSTVFDITKVSDTEFKH